MKQVEVTIMGHGYRLSCEEGGEAQLMQAVAAVDREMSSIRDAGRVKARDRIAVLAALKLAAVIPEGSEGGMTAVTRIAPSATPSKVAPGKPPSAVDTGAAADTAHDAALDALIAKVDAALGDDGRLL
jgi:cell division protein ZapA